MDFLMALAIVVLIGAAIGYFRSGDSDSDGGDDNDYFDNDGGDSDNDGGGD